MARGLKMFVRLFRIKASESLKNISRSYLQRRKMEKQGQKEPLTTWECQNYKKSSQQLPSCVTATRLAVLQKYFSHYSALSMKRGWKFFQRKSIQVKEKKQRRKLAFGTLIPPKLAQILKKTSGTRQVWVWSFFFFDHCIKQIDSMLSWVCSVIDHRRRQNVVETSVTHSLTARVPLLCFYHVLTTSSVMIYYWTNARQHGI